VSSSLDAGPNTTQAEALAIALDITRGSAGEEDWSVFLHLAELSKDEVSGFSADELLDLGLRIASAGASITLLTAMDLRPGRGGAFVVLPPSTDPYVVESLGEWPSQIRRSSYNATTSGVDRQGTFFRHKRGTWSRARHRESFQRGESVVVLGDARYIATPPAPSTQIGAPTAAKGTLWSAWRIDIPRSPSPELCAWLSARGHAIGDLQLDARLRALPLSIVNDRYQYASGDFILVEATGPNRSLTATIADGHGRPLARRTVDLDQATGAALVTVGGALAAGQYEVDLGKGTELAFDIIEPLSENDLRARISALPRLRVWVDGTLVLSSPEQPLALPGRSKAPVVRVDAMLPEARVSLLVQTDRRRRVYPSVTAREAEIVLAEHLVARQPTRFEVDAGALGRITANVHLKAPSGQGHPETRMAPWIVTAGKRQQGAHLREFARKAPSSARMLRVCTTGAARLYANRLRRL